VQNLTIFHYTCLIKKAGKWNFTGIHSFRTHPFVFDSPPTSTSKHIFIAGESRHIRYYTEKS
jgi:hypothetical protein